MRIQPRAQVDVPDPPISARGTTPFGSNLLGVLRLSIFVTGTILAAPFQVVVLLVAPKLWWFMPLHYHRWTCWLLGFRIEQRGKMSTDHPTLFVSNHTSYLDIPVLGSLLKTAFVAKAEVAKWPFFGVLSKLQRTVFVDRQRNTAHHQRDNLQRHLKAGDNLVLFPEGTSNDGNRVKPFRSALLSVAESTREDDMALTIQPVSIAYVGINGLPMGHGLRPLVAWYGDMSLGPHLWQFSRLGLTRVIVEFHPAVKRGDFPSRKELTKYCAEQVQRGVSSALSGRASAAPEPNSGPVIFQ